METQDVQFGNALQGSDLTASLGVATRLQDAAPAARSTSHLDSSAESSEGASDPPLDRPRRRPVAERLWRKVDKAGPVPAHMPHLGPCWLWTGSLNNAGYGQINLGVPDRVVMVTVHRLSWEIANGPVPEGRMVLHHCDVRHCVNSEHLFLGDAKANALDSVAKGRWRKCQYAVTVNGKTTVQHLTYAQRERLSVNLASIGLDHVIEPARGRA